ncbi:MAG: twin-arginine translocation signal domain-containing protein [Rubrobacter sp.]
MESKLSRRKFLYMTTGTAAGAVGAGIVGGPARAQEKVEGGSEGGSSGGLQQISQNSGPVFGTSFVSPAVELFGDIFIGERCFVAGNTILRAAPTLRLEIGDETNAQDNVVARALDENSTVGSRVSLAHHAIVRDSEVGDFAFVGFWAVIEDAVVGEGCLIMARGRVRGVTLAPNRVVGPGVIVEDQATADALPTIDEMGEEFKLEVLEVNAEFAESYIELYEEEGYQAVIGAGAEPLTSFNPERVEPQVASDVELGEFVRIVGDVRIGSGSRIRQRTSVRADEGAPIIIGPNADIRNRVTFHALKDTSLVVGDNLFADDDAVLHGPLKAGSNISVGNESVLFRARVEDDVTIGDRAVVQGSASEDGTLELVIPSGTVIPDGAVVTDAETLAQYTGRITEIPDTGGVSLRDIIPGL